MAWVFLSYDRSDTEADANALYLSLVAELGSDAVFKDVDNVGLGENWRTAVERAVEQSVIVLAMIGPDWELSEAIELELTTAVRAGIPIVPVLVRGGRLDAHRGRLPETLAELPYVNGALLDHATWGRDLEPVLAHLRRFRPDQSASRVAPASTPPPVPDSADDYGGLSNGSVLQRAVLMDALRQVVPAAAVEDKRTILKCVLLESVDDRLRLVATDSYRLALRDVDVLAIDDFRAPLAVDAQALLSAVDAVPAEAATVWLLPTDAGLEIQSEARSHTVPLVDDEYPNYRNLLPVALPTTVISETAALVEAAQEVARAAADEPVHLSYSNGRIALTTTTGSGFDTSWHVAGELDGTPPEVALGPGYLVDGLAAVHTPTTRIEWRDPLSPIIIRSADGSFSYLLMPIRVPTDGD